MIGQVVGHFRIEDTLGQGGMGVVYRAHDERLRRTVALKLLPAQWAQDPAARARLLREARAAAAVTHQNIATVYEVGEDNGRVYLAMEAIEGRTLRSWLNAGRLPLEEALRICREIARGVARAHEKGIVHRDLKPENVMITDEGDVKVLDFGLARQSDSVDAGATKPADNLSTPGTLVGTPAYMSPEQAMGQPVDARSDVFSLGLILYELSVGQHPFAGTNPVGVAVAIVRDDPPAPSSVNAEIPAALDRTIATCLAKRPRERYSTARDLLRDLEILAPHRSSGATTARVAPRSRFKWPAVVAFTACVATIAGGLLLWSWRSTSDSRPASRAKVADQRRPMSSNPEAVRSYLEGEDATRDGRWKTAEEAFQKAVKLDPTMGAAWLRLALTGGEGKEGREFFRQASMHRSSLDEHDQAWLDALEPMLQRHPSDDAESIRRLRALARRYPDDAGVAVYLADTLALSADVPPETHLAEALAATRMDPKRAGAWVSVARAHKRLNDGEAAMAALDRCLVENTAAISCLDRRIEILAATGKCEAMEADARRLLTVEPNGDGAAQLANALIAQGQDEAARELLPKVWNSLPEHVRSLAAAGDLAHLDTRDGNFLKAIERWRAFQNLETVKNNSEEEDHAEAARQLAGIFEEIGRPQEAARTARTFLGRRSAWEPDPTRSEEAAIEDPTGLLLATWRRSGGLSAEDLRRQRQARLDWWDRRLGKSWLRYYVWETIYASAVQTPAEAAEALAARPQFGRFYGPSRFGHDLAALGRTYLLAGRIDEALPQLERAATSCVWFGYLSRPLAHVRAWYLLGEARAAKGDKPGACAAYDKLLERWGKARPRSVTAEKARARRAALGCGS